jgi:PQQ-like domain
VSNDLENLVQTAANTLVSAIATDAWESVKRRFAGIVGRRRQLDNAPAELAARGGSDQARAQLVREWADNLRDALDENPGAEPALRTLLADVRVTTTGPINSPAYQRSGRGSTAGNVGSINNSREVYVGVGKVDKRKFRFSPVVLFGHAFSAHPVVTSVVTLVVLAGGGVTGGVVLAHKAGAHAAAPPPVVVPVASSGDWGQADNGPDRTGNQPDESRIGTGNVGKLALARSYRAGPNASAPLISGGILYVDNGTLYAFDATGARGCSATPAACTPLWTAPTADFTSLAVADGAVFVTDQDGVQAFSAAGTRGCSGSPKVCVPLWATSINVSTGLGFTPGRGSPVVAGGVLYVPGYGDGLVPSKGGALVAAFDAAGTAGCSGTPRVCVPLWTTTALPVSTGNSGSPTVAGGVLYIASGSLYAFDAAGSSGCTGTPKVCAPKWTAVLPGSGTGSPPAVAGGMVYVGTSAGLDAFDASGTRNCSSGVTPETCSPLWTAAIGGVGGSPAVAQGVVYAVSGPGLLYALDAAGSKHCQGAGTVKTCTALWTSAPLASGYLDSSSPAVANGVVYASSTSGGTYGYDASGSRQCAASAGASASASAAGSGLIKSCAPLWSSPVVGLSSDGSPAVVNGAVFVNIAATIYAYAS